MSRLHDLHLLERQSVWLDNLSRSHLDDGSLDRRIADGVRGLTSNPTIFAKAIQGSNDYDAQFAELVSGGMDPLTAYWDMVLDDIARACDAFAALHHESGGSDGFVSVEVAPDLARDSQGTLAAARSLHDRLARPNAMIKIPATVEGLPAIRSMIGEGRSVNVTLIFGLERYADVMEAYIAGLEDLAADPSADLSAVSSVASFFISRVDTEVDRRLDALGSQNLQGTAALTQGRLAYAQFVTAFSGPRWEALSARGARAQRPLWASTGTKNPAYSDVMYVDGLIGPDTVNTLPEPTLDAFVDHGAVSRTIDADPARDHAIWEGLAEAGIDMSDVAQQLEHEGLDSFAASFDEVIDALAMKAGQLRK
ncbi:MAG: transaldolase [Actinomycetota bacterium]|jgi:transaldolase|nr:transaldolase [Actinomycetota bacterium]MDA3014165.1 transaldolase [Actinomycetota bacterium]MDA3028516.1 transaldolase [Actinomycetota bacterium]